MSLQLNDDPRVGVERSGPNVGLLLVAALIGAVVMFAIYYIGFAGVETDLRDMYPALNR